MNELTIKQIILTTDNKNYQIKPELMNIKKLLVDLLMSYEQGITHGSFNYKLINKFPEFRLIPNDLIWNLILSPLESNETIVRKRTQAWMARPYTDMIFTKENFESTMKFLRNQLQQFGRLKFFGRRITADEFICELTELRKGNFNNRDEENKVFQCPNCRGDTKADCLNNPEVRAIYEGLQLRSNESR